ncbi:hypothetical protein Ae201684P_018628 [Aphanomyces euteiches]|uniref:Uncharacterized protein n=1 Tax=Aphanomyces euteiches TaxID=100861 RepID=A0A6G0XUN9_9STRA|nr:hypothetical protein Ae201684_001277 [Aphanomyces euteiches]KAH9099615.1 hypothetical protein Ae201684P_018628 [Aphanomyces euteiches]KAH9135720.1 hypothetical protein AeRB84_018936 [Aphanomyces euteiches]
MPEFLIESHEHGGRRRRHHSPYLDVMTVQSRQYIAQKDLVEEPHSKLLIEPIHIPDLVHTGISLAKPGSMSSPMFYPNGAKNVHLRQVIQTSLSMVSTDDAVLGDKPKQTTLQSSLSLDALPSVTKKSKKNHLGGVKSAVDISSPKKLNQRSIRDLTKDKETKQLLTAMRINTTKITGLVNPHAT